MTMSRKTFKLTLAGAFLACAVGGLALRDTKATPASETGFASTPLAGAVLKNNIDTWAETDDWELEVRTRGESQIFFTHFKLAPGAHGGWHSHPGPSFIAVKSGTATFYDDCVDPSIPIVVPAGTGFVEEAGCVHILTNEGDVDLEVVVMQIVPKGAPRRIDEANPNDPAPGR
jgi:quercetin dioxygenase-like cupin family protein